ALIRPSPWAATLAPALPSFSAAPSWMAAILGSETSRAPTSLLSSVLALPWVLMTTRGGSQVTSPIVFTAQFAWHDRSTWGGSSWPEHLGSSMVPLQPPSQRPLHSACPLISQLALQLPEQVPEQLPSAFASHLPS